LAELQMRPEMQLASAVHGSPTPAGGVAHTLAELQMRPEMQLASAVHGSPTPAGGVAHTFAELQMRPEMQLASAVHGSPTPAGGVAHTFAALQISPSGQFESLIQASPAAAGGSRVTHKFLSTFLHLTISPDTVVALCSLEYLLLEHVVIEQISVPARQSQTAPSPHRYSIHSSSAFPVGRRHVPPALVLLHLQWSGSGKQVSSAAAATVATTATETAARMSKSEPRILSGIIVFIFMAGAGILGWLGRSLALLLSANFGDAVERIAVSDVQDHYVCVK
jgi:hypothetical protein